MGTNPPDVAGKVSVIIPTYNRAHFIKNAVESIQNQEYKNLEIVIVDDGSRDDTAEIVRRLQEEDQRIRFFSNDRTKGPSGARNTGILNSSGEYVAFLDSDDVWLSGHLEKGIEIFENHHDVDVLFGNFTVADFVGNKSLYNFFDKKELFPTLNTVPISPGARQIKDDLFRALIRENFFLVGSSLHRRKVIDGILFEENITYAEDRDFAIRLYMEKGAKFAFRVDPVFILYRHDSSLTQYDDLPKRQKLIQSHLFLFSKYLKNYDLSRSNRILLNKLISNEFLALAGINGEMKRYRLMLGSLVESCKRGISLGQPKALLKLIYLALVMKEN
ncbi:MAG TPA: glycosyltransferase family 2 protein [Syntrophorhabdaceae bacterium]|jgi:glycosyltransferase involved in cell wall biosynthesis